MVVLRNTALAESKPLQLVVIPPLRKPGLHALVSTQADLLIFVQTGSQSTICQPTVSLEMLPIRYGGPDSKILAI